MSGVVLRCPNCGTTKATPGECEACHESQVRHFCTNHKPGRWLDTGACPQCGARFGESTRPVAPSRPAAAPSPAGPMRPPAPASGAPSTPRRPEPPSRPPVEDSDAWGRRRRPPSPMEESAARDERATRRAPAASREADPHREPEPFRDSVRARPVPSETMHVPIRPPAGRSLGGCLVRMVLLAGLLLFAILSVFFGLGGMLLQLFGVFY